MSPIKVLIVDDHPVVRQGLRSLLSNSRDISVVGEAATGPAGLAAARRYQPDVVLMDIRLCGLDGIEVARQLRQSEPAPKVIILSSYDDEQYLERALQADVSAYLLKHASDEVLVGAIREACTVASGSSAPPELQLGETSAPRNQSLPGARADNCNSGSCRWTSLCLHDHCQTIPQPARRPSTHRPAGHRIGARAPGPGSSRPRNDRGRNRRCLENGRRTVEMHRRRVMRKLGLSNQTQLVIYALEQSLVRPSELSAAFSGMSISTGGRRRPQAP